MPWPGKNSSHAWELLFDFTHRACAEQWQIQLPVLRVAMNVVATPNMTLGGSRHGSKHISQDPKADGSINLKDTKLNTIKKGHIANGSNNLMMIIQVPGKEQDTNKNKDTWVSRNKTDHSKNKGNKRDLNNKSGMSMSSSIGNTTPMNGTRNTRQQNIGNIGNIGNSDQSTPSKETTVHTQQDLNHGRPNLTKNAQTIANQSQCPEKNIERVNGKKIGSRNGRQNKTRDLNLMPSASLRTSHFRTGCERSGQGQWLPYSHGSESFDVLE